jgi:hypothetical protein
MAFLFRIVAGIRSLAAALDQDVPLVIVSILGLISAAWQAAYLECILSRETLVAMCTRERFYRKMYSLVTLEIVVPIEALGALVALEWPVVRSLLLVLGMAQEMWHLGGVSTVESGHHAWMYSTHQRQLPIGVVDIREDGSGARDVVSIWSLILVGRRCWVGGNGRYRSVRHGRRHSRHGASCADRALLGWRRAT